jgi:hypothetical protein
MNCSLRTGVSCLLTFIAASFLGCEIRKQDAPSAVNAISTTSQTTGTEALRIAFSSQNVGLVAEEANRVLSSGSPPSSVVFLKQVWESDSVAVEGLPSAFLRDVSVRALIANVLSQAYANGDIQLDSSSLLDALRAGLSVADPRVAGAALRGIAPLAEDQDTDRIALVAERGPDLLTRSALASLSSICGTYAESTIQRLSRTSKNSLIRAEALDTYSSMQPIRNMRCNKTRGASVPPIGQR